MIAATVTLTLTWEAAAYALMAVLLLHLAVRMIDRLGDGPNYTWRQNVSGVAAVVCAIVAGGLVIEAVAMVLP